MIEAAIALLVLLQIKHWYIDFVNQTMEEVQSKGIYGSTLGIWHSSKQALGTLFAVLVITGHDYFFEAAFIALVDFVIHYHMDWAKININRRYNYTANTPQFWWWLGFDQLVHQLTYLLILYLVFV
jgi:Protein of unknown function (DUF3307)